MEYPIAKATSEKIASKKISIKAVVHFADELCTSVIFCGSAYLKERHNKVHINSQQLNTDRALKMS